jgi:hypothetical protein
VICESEINTLLSPALSELLTSKEEPELFFSVFSCGPSYPTAKKWAQKRVFHLLTICFYFGRRCELSLSLSLSLFFFHFILSEIY